MDRPAAGGPCRDAQGRPGRQRNRSRFWFRPEAPGPLLIPARQPCRTRCERSRPWPPRPAGDQEAGTPV